MPPISGHRQASVTEDLGLYTTNMSLHLRRYDIPHAIGEVIHSWYV